MKFAINIFVRLQWLKKTNRIQPYATFTYSQTERIPLTNLNKMYRDNGRNSRDKH